MYDGKPFDLGLFVGRFQHLHMGHQHVIDTAMKLCDRLLIMVGSSQEKGTLRNPFDISTRIHMIEEVYPFSTHSGIIKVVALPDLTTEDDITPRSVTPEEWKSIQDYEGLYEVSSHGRVRSLSRTVSCAYEKSRSIEGRELVSEKVNNGYLRIKLAKDNTKKNGYIHRLVALAFLEEPIQDANIVNHKDGNKENNVAENLEWVTSQQNCAHSVRMGLTDFYGENNPNAKLSEVDVEQIRLLYAEGAQQSDLSQMFDISQGNISMIVNNKRWQEPEKQAKEEHLWGRYVLKNCTQHMRKGPEIMLYGNDEARSRWFDPMDIKHITEVIVSRDIVGISATLMRQYLKEDDFPGWAKYADPRLHKHYDALRAELTQVEPYRVVKPLKGWSDKEI